MCSGRQVTHAEFVWSLVETLHQRRSVVPSCAFPASIPLILGIGTGAVQGRNQNTRLGAGFSIENWHHLVAVIGRVLICRQPSDCRYGLVPVFGCIL